MFLLTSGAGHKSESTDHTSQILGMVSLVGKRGVPITFDIFEPMLSSELNFQKHTN